MNIIHERITIQPARENESRKIYTKENAQQNGEREKKVHILVFLLKFQVTFPSTE
jgi:hypothetical protein